MVDAIALGRGFIEQTFRKPEEIELSFIQHHVHHDSTILFKKKAELLYISELIIHNFECAGQIFFGLCKSSHKLVV